MLLNICLLFNNLSLLINATGRNCWYSLIQFLTSWLQDSLGGSSVFGVFRPTCMEEGLRWWAHCSRWWNTAQVSKHNHFIQNTEMLLQKPVTGHLMWCPVWAAASLKHVKQWREYLTSDKIIWCRLGESGSSEPSSSVCPRFCPEKWFRNRLFWQDHCWLDSWVVYSVNSVSVRPLVWMWLED